MMSSHLSLLVINPALLNVHGEVEEAFLLLLLNRGLCRFACKCVFGDLTGFSLYLFTVKLNISIFLCKICPSHRNLQRIELTLLEKS